MVLTDANEKIISDISIDIEPKAVAIGMGIGKDKATVNALEKFLKNTKAALVIDADGLNILSENKSLLKLLPKNSVLTPHPGELKRLIGEWKDDYDKLKKVRKFSEKYQVVILIKGTYTFTVFGNKQYINTSGSPGMATAGSGDALSGIIAGLLSQGYDPLIASVFGVYLHGSAGNIASEKMGYEAVMAGDIIKNLGEAYFELFQKESSSEESRKK